MREATRTAGKILGEKPIFETEEMLQELCGWSNQTAFLLFFLLDVVRDADAA